MSQLFWNNPVLLREMQERVRSRRTMVMITAWLVLLCSITALYYVGEASNTFGNQFDPFGNSVLRLARVGQNMFDWLLFFMMALILFLVPGFTAASIAGERERQTLLPMQVTLLRPIDIVIGKIAASVVFVLVLIAVTAPVLAFAYIIGGVTIGEVFISLAMLLFSAVAIACITVACSAVVRRVPAAIVTAYVVMLALSVGSLAVFGIVAAIDDSRGFDATNPPLTLLAVNPIVALADVSDSSASNDFFNGAETPLAALREMLRVTQFRDEFGIRQAGVFIEGRGGVGVAQAVPVPPPPGFPGELQQVIAQQQNPNARAIDRAVPYWMQNLLAMTALSAASIWIAARRLATPAQVER